MTRQTQSQVDYDAICREFFLARIKWRWGFWGIFWMPVFFVGYLLLFLFPCENNLNGSFLLVFLSIWYMGLSLTFSTLLGGDTGNNETPDFFAIRPIPRGCFFRWVLRTYLKGSGIFFFLLLMASFRLMGFLSPTSLILFWLSCLAGASLPLACFIAYNYFITTQNWLKSSTRPDAFFVRCSNLAVALVGVQIISAMLFWGISHDLMGGLSFFWHFT